MKKSIILMFVLGITVVANAALQISVNGDPDPVDSEYTLLPSDNLVLDIHAYDENQQECFVIMVETAVATISGGPTPIVPIILQIFPPNYGPIPDGWNGICGSIENPSGNIPDGMVVDLIDFHCEAPGDAVVELWASDDGGAYWQLDDTVIIHQVSVLTPLIGVDPYILDFVVEEYLADPDDQVLSVWNDGVGILDWTIEEDWSNLTVTPDSGTSSGEVNAVVASVELSGLPQGIYISDFTVSDPNAANNPQTVTARLTNECIFNDSPMYDDWVGVGKPWNRPDCWCYERHCRGDADGQKIGMFWVQTNDLAIFASAFAKSDGQLDQTKICGDFDHKKVGMFRVQTDDLAIFASYFSKTPVNVPVCPLDWDGDGDDDYNFWVTP